MGVGTFAPVALRVGQVAQSASRRKFSKCRGTQSQLAAIWGLMCYEDWTFRETAARLAEHCELRAALGLT